VARKAKLYINPLFKLLLIVNSALCVASGAVMIVMAITVPDPMTKAQDRLLNDFGHVFTVTTGAFIGLLGGRAGAPDRIQNEPESPPAKVT
jgi:hypothetical protein